MPLIQRKLHLTRLTTCCFFFTMFLVLVFSTFTTMALIAYFSIDITNYSALDPNLSPTVSWLLILEATSLIASVFSFIYLNSIRRNKENETYGDISVFSWVAAIVSLFIYLKNSRSITTDLNAISPLLNAAAVLWHCIWVAFLSCVLLSIVIVLIICCK
eukprot:gnl/Dysnectes_brevis/8185_a14394_350.p1 GENE.gnl/Dysnectes_brevis/8185_a14394_350~~gnl/Dysnectes_brevis/8185_a14394_350.p1  ORF type:complete len:159 (-),score=3.68 gnl/Dysnectes_brevis/8185_a14394_350:101-577(-)